MRRDGKSFGPFLLAVVVSMLLAGCTTTPPPVTAKPEVTREVFESEDFIVVLAKAGDTTQSLAAKYLGDSTKDWMIEDYNGAATLSPGQQVVIPKRFWKLSGVDASGFQLVPVLVYHNIAPQAKGRMTLAVKTFEEEMRYLKSQGIHVVSLKEFLEFASLSRQLPRQSLVLTFDDGYKSFLHFAYPVLKELGFGATLFVYTDYIGAGGNALSWADLKKLSAEGFDIEAHSKSHGDMRKANGESAKEYAKRLDAELSLPKALFQKNLGFTPEILAYPFGGQDDTVVRQTQERGYVAGFTVLRQGNPSFVDRLRIHRSQIYSEMTMDDFIKNLNFFNQEALK